MKFRLLIAFVSVVFIPVDGYGTPNKLLLYSSKRSVKEHGLESKQQKQICGEEHGIKMHAGHGKGRKRIAVLLRGESFRTVGRHAHACWSLDLKRDGTDNYTMAYLKTVGLDTPRARRRFLKYEFENTMYLSNVSVWDCIDFVRTYAHSQNITEFEADSYIRREVNHTVAIGTGDDTWAGDDYKNSACVQRKTDLFFQLQLFLSTRQVQLAENHRVNVDFFLATYKCYDDWAASLKSVYGSYLKDSLFFTKTGLRSDEIRQNQVTTTLEGLKMIANYSLVNSIDYSAVYIRRIDEGPYFLASPDATMQLFRMPRGLNDVFISTYDSRTLTEGTFQGMLTPGSPIYRPAFAGFNTVRMGQYDDNIYIPWLMMNCYIRSLYNCLIALDGSKTAYRREHFALGRCFQQLDRDPEQGKVYRMRPFQSQSQAPAPEMKADQAMQKLGQYPRDKGLEMSLPMHRR